MISHIDTQKCIGCGTCFKTCALGVFRMDTEQDNISPCTATCPAGNNIRKINGLLQESRFDEALECLVDTMPFPAITGRVCPHPCESRCSRLERDAAVNINGIENFLGELDLARKVSPVPHRHISRVAVAGSGPAGLSAAWYLTLAGYPVTVFEAREKPGGLLSHGIPEYRLPGSLVDAYIARLQDMGVEFRCNCPLGNKGGMTLDNLDDLGFRAVVLAIGAGRGRPLPVPGAENMPHVVQGIDFLADARAGRAAHVAGKTVLVLGGGDVAADAAVTAARLGAGQVRLVYRRSRERMPALPHNIASAEAHGVELLTAWGIQSLKESAGGLQATFAANTAPEAASPQPPVYDLSQTMDIDADLVIAALGQDVDPGFPGSEIALTESGRIQADPLTLQTSVRTIFAAGDAVSGSGTVVQAIAAGRRAAHSIGNLLQGAHTHMGHSPRREIASMEHLDRLETIKRNDRSHQETGIPLSIDEALGEALRCLTCGSKARIAYTDDCMTCFSCEMNCPANAIDVSPFKQFYPRHLGKHFVGDSK